VKWLIDNCVSFVICRSIIPGFNVPYFSCALKAAQRGAGQGKGARNALGETNAAFDGM
jgi:hypothetical protein